MTEATYRGDLEFSIECTGDCVKGDLVRFERATFTGSFKRPKFMGFELVTGEIVCDSYGAEKQQHTFTLKLPDESRIRIKGRNLYANGIWRKPWADETLRDIEAHDKHERGDFARAARDQRREAEGWIG